MDKLIIHKRDGRIEITLTNGGPPGCKLQLGTTTTYIRINNEKWKKSPFRSSYKTKLKAEQAETVEEFLKEK